MESQTCLSWIVEVACVVGDVIELGVLCDDDPRQDFGMAAFKTGSDAAVMAKKISTVVHWMLRTASSVVLSARSS